MSDNSTIDSQGQLLTNDGVPLKESLRKSLRRSKNSLVPSSITPSSIPINYVCYANRIATIKKY